MFRALTDELLTVLLPGRCPGCGRRTAPVCGQCARTVRRAPARPPPAGIDWWVACFAYTGVVRELIARAKYRDERAAARWFLPHLVDAVGPIRAATDIVTWVPASAERLRGHGVDHGEVLARRVAAALGLPVMGLLDRSRSRAQTGLDARERRRGPPLLARCALDNASVLVVDDVTTTGGTLVAGARALRAHGARQIFAATIARTLHPAEHARDPAYTPSHQ